MSEWRTLDSENALIRSVDDAPDANVLVRNNDADNRLCYIYCSSKNLYQNNNRGAFAASVIDMIASNGRIVRRERYPGGRFSSWRGIEAQAARLSGGSMKKVYYVGFYDVLRQGIKVRSYSLAAARKMDFICDVLGELGYDVDILSPAYITAQGMGYVGARPETIGAGRRLILTPSWSAKNKLSRIARVLVSKAWLFAHLVRHCGRESDVVVYHNYQVSLPVLLAQKIRRFRLLLEIEEQYSMVWKLTPWQKWKEDLLLKHGGDGCMVVSELLAEKLGVSDPIVSYGNYNAYRGEIPDKANPERIRLAYTGSIDRVKNSAYMALEIMPHLPEQYELKLSGPIAKGEETQFRAALEDVNRRCGRQACEYLGVLNDEDYAQLLLSAHIALNLQQEGEFGEFLFPSKILTYLSYNLPVVSTRGGSIVKSAVADLLNFADGYAAEDIVRAVRNVRLGEAHDYRARLEEMSGRFKKRIGRTLKKAQV